MMSDNEMTYRLLGSTGERVSSIGFGGWHLALKHVDKKLAIRIVHAAIDRGINFLDNSWDYNGGESEVAKRGGARADKEPDPVRIHAPFHCLASMGLDSNVVCDNIL